MSIDGSPEVEAEGADGFPAAATKDAGKANAPILKCKSLIRTKLSEFCDCIHRPPTD